MLRLIYADGWELVVVRGSHRQFKHPSKQGRLTVPGKALRRLASQDPSKHPASSRAETMSTTVDTSRYLILIEGGPPSNYSAWSPDLPGCVATGATATECERHMHEAISLHLEGIASDGGQIPTGSGPGVYIERTAA